MNKVIINDCLNDVNTCLIVTLHLKYTFFITYINIEKNDTDDINIENENNQIASFKFS